MGKVIKRSLKYYENLHNSAFPNHQIKVLYRENRHVYFNTEFGLCKKDYSTFGGYNYSILSAIDKTDYLKKQLIKIYKDKFDYSLVEFKSSKPLIVDLGCITHDFIFKKNVSNALGISANCPICLRENKMGRPKIFTNDEFINKANIVHDFKYDYSGTIYILGKLKVKIICKIHGEFEQQAQSHLRGFGCPFCGWENSSKLHSQNPSGWTLTNWKDKATTSKHFDSFKVYIIECWNNNERFYKIGRTFSKVSWRFRNKKLMPYNYKILKIYEDTAEDTFKLELEMKKINKENKYSPDIHFNGERECFNKLN